MGLSGTELFIQHPVTHTAQFTLVNISNHRSLILFYQRKHELSLRHLSGIFDRPLPAIEK
jgi:hypothetical protein